MRILLQRPDITRCGRAVTSKRVGGVIRERMPGGRVTYLARAEVDDVAAVRARSV
jgi:hypothetical protein